MTRRHHRRCRPRRQRPGLLRLARWLTTTVIVRPTLATINTLRLVIVWWIRTSLTGHPTAAPGTGTVGVEVEALTTIAAQWNARAAAGQPLGGPTEPVAPTGPAAPQPGTGPAPFPLDETGQLLDPADRYAYDQWQRARELDRLEQLRQTPPTTPAPAPAPASAPAPAVAAVPGPAVFVPVAPPPAGAAGPAPRASLAWLPMATAMLAVSVLALIVITVDAFGPAINDWLDDHLPTTTTTR